MSLITTLKNYGLNDRQSKVYLACLELGSAPVQKISTIADMPRTTCYQILESLRPLGLISSFQKKRVKYFSVEDPRKFVNEAFDKAEQLQQALPRLVAMYGTSETKPSMRFYQGRPALKRILFEFLDEAKELIAFSSSDELINIQRDFSDYVAERQKRKIPAKVIMRDSPEARAIKNEGSQALRDVRIISPAFIHHNLTFIWNSKIAIFTFEGDFTAFVIESPAVAEFYRTTFNYIWGTLKN